MVNTACLFSKMAFKNSYWMSLRQSGSPSSFFKCLTLLPPWVFVDAPPNAPSVVFFFLELAVALGALPPWAAGVRASSSSVISWCRTAEGVPVCESVSPSTCCSEVRGSARTGDDARVVICSSISEVSTVDPGDLGPSCSVILTR